MPESHPDIQTVYHMYGAACASPQTSDHGARALTLKAHSELGESSRVRALRPDAGRIPSGKRRRRSNLACAALRFLTCNHPLGADRRVHSQWL